MKIWIILEAENTDYSRQWGYGTPKEYRLSEEAAIERIKELAAEDSYPEFYCEEFEIDARDFMPAAS